ncbi:cupin domain-containing protein [Labilibaculum euxinus]
MSYVSTNELKFIPTTHLVGLKKIIENQGRDSLVTQVAIGVLRVGESIALHKHDTMDEYYYFLSGDGVFYCSEKEYQCKRGDFVKIPKGTMHGMVSGNNDLEFFYFGINNKKNG